MFTLHLAKVHMCMLNLVFKRAKKLYILTVSKTQMSSNQIKKHRKLFLVLFYLKKCNIEIKYEGKRKKLSTSFKLNSADSSTLFECIIVRFIISFAMLHLIFLFQAIILTKQSANSTEKRC
jgi:hypothetical protein